MGSILKRLDSEAKRLLSHEFASGQIDRLPVERIKPYVQPLDSDIPLADFHDLVDRVIRTTDPHDTSIDALTAAHLHKALPLTRRQASDPGIWRYLAVVERPDYVRHRWESFNASGLHYWSLAIRPEGNTFARLWWITELTRSGDSYAATRQILESQTLTNWTFKNSFSHHEPMLRALLESTKRADVRISAEQLVKAVSGRLTVVNCEAHDCNAARTLLGPHDS
jgi:hypothetical protein